MFEFKEVSFSYEKTNQTVLEKVNFQIKQGSLTLITGPSGSGKSTLLKLMNGLIPRVYPGKIEGAILFEKRSLQQVSQEFISKHIGYVSQDPRGQFFTTNTTSELVFAMENFGLRPNIMREKVKELTELLELSTLLNRSIFSLSSGERQKISIGCSLSLSAKFIILDEPSSNLDVQAIQKLMELLMDLKKKGFTIVVAEHRVHYLAALIDQVLLVNNQTVTVSTIQSLSQTGNPPLRKLALFQNQIEFPYSEIENEVILSVKAMSYHAILKAINFDIKAGDSIGIIGKNGVGKTTLLKLLMNIIQPTTGKLVAHTKQKIAPFLVMQEMDYQFFTESVASELALGNEHIDKQQQDALLKKMGLYTMKNRSPFDLSGGEKQRLLVAIAVLAKTNLFLFDEPTSGLDNHNMKKVATLITNLKTKGAVVIATHDAEFLYKTCNRILYLKNGELVEEWKLHENDGNVIKQLFQKMIHE